jgi:hypothetical protein
MTIRSRCFTFVTPDAHERRKLRVGIALVYLDLVGTGAVELDIEVAGVRIGIGPRSLRHLGNQ